MDPSTATSRMNETALTANVLAPLPLLKSRAPVSPTADTIHGMKKNESMVMTVGVEPNRVSPVLLTRSTKTASSYLAGKSAQRAASVAKYRAANVRGRIIMLLMTMLAYFSVWDAGNIRLVLPALLSVSRP